MHSAGNNDPAASGFVDRDRRRLRDSSGSVIEGGIGDVQGCELGDHRLILVNRLQAPLAHLGLVRCVRGVELGPPGDGRYSARDVMAIRARPQKRWPVIKIEIPGREAVQQPQHFQLTHSGRDWGGAAAQALRHVLEQILDLFNPDPSQHRRSFLRRMRQIRHQCRSAVLRS